MHAGQENSLLLCGFWCQVSTDRPPAVVLPKTSHKDSPSATKTPVFGNDTELPAADETFCLFCSSIALAMKRAESGIVDPPASAAPPASPSQPQPPVLRHSSRQQQAADPVPSPREAAKAQLAPLPAPTPATPQVPLLLSFIHRYLLLVVTTRASQDLD